MTAKDVLRLAFQAGLDWATGVAKDMADAPLTQPTPRGGNHPMWVIGHSAFAEAGLLAMITGGQNPLEQWKPIFSGGTEPTGRQQDYPPFEEVLAAFTRHRQATLQWLEAADDGTLDSAPPNVPEHLQGYPPFKTIGGLLTFIALHQVNHVGQLCDARRAAGRKWTN